MVAVTHKYMTRLHMTDVVDLPRAGRRRDLAECLLKTLPNAFCLWAARGDICDDKGEEPHRDNSAACS